MLKFVRDVIKDMVKEVEDFNRNFEEKAKRGMGLSNFDFTSGKIYNNVVQSQSHPNKIVLLNDKGKLVKVEKDNLKKAINISLEVRKVAQAVEKIGYRLTKIGDKNMHADARTAIHLAHASSKSALENIKVVKKELVKIK